MIKTMMNEGQVKKKKKIIRVYDTCHALHTLLKKSMEHKKEYRFIYDLENYALKTPILVGEKKKVRGLKLKKIPKELRRQIRLNWGDVHTHPMPKTIERCYFSKKDLSHNYGEQILYCPRVDYALIRNSSGTRQILVKELIEKFCNTEKSPL